MFSKQVVDSEPLDVHGFADLCARHHAAEEGRGLYHDFVERHALVQHVLELQLVAYLNRSNKIGMLFSILSYRSVVILPVCLEPLKQSFVNSLIVPHQYSHAVILIFLFS